MFSFLPQLIASRALWWSWGLIKRFCGISSRPSNSFISCCTLVTPEQLNCRRLQMPINVQQEAFMFSCFRPTYRCQRPVKGISIISAHIKALRSEILIWILRTLWHFPDRKPYHWSDLGLATAKSLHLLSPISYLESSSLTAHAGLTRRATLESSGWGAILIGFQKTMHITGSSLEQALQNGGKSNRKYTKEISGV